MGFAMDYSSVGKDFSILNRLCGNKLIDKQIFSVYRNRSLTEQKNNQTRIVLIDIQVWINYFWDVG